jgi:PD-(D/E)XK endonuclease
MLRGCAVSFPAEPTIYDLLADTPQGIMRVQVKTTTSAAKNGWQVGVGHHPDTHSKKKGHILAYSPDEIDLFFIVDGDMTMYLIPSRAIAGRGPGRHIAQNLPKVHRRERSGIARCSRRRGR